MKFTMKGYGKQKQTAPPLRSTLPSLDELERLSQPVIEIREPGLYLIQRELDGSLSSTRLAQEAPVPDAEAEAVNRLLAEAAETI
jgi:hypothetical protein